MKSAIVLFPGSNRERDMAMALVRAGGAPPVTRLAQGDGVARRRPGRGAGRLPRRLSARRCDGRPLPYHGGGDRGGERGVPILGVCNGFQVLTESGLLPGALMRNAGLKFVCRNVDMAVTTTDSLFTSKYASGQAVSIPVAHNDGNYFADPETLDRLEGEDRIAFRYTDPNGTASEGSNPNGSIRNIAGILSENRRVLGFMPHPENATDPLLGGTDGAPMFDGIVEALS